MGSVIIYSTFGDFPDNFPLTLGLVRETQPDVQRSTRQSYGAEETTCVSSFSLCKM